MKKFSQFTELQVIDGEVFIVGYRRSKNIKVKLEDAILQAAGGATSGFKGTITPSDTPTEDGVYFPTEAGTYANAGNLVYDPEGVDKGKLVQFFNKDGVWTKSGIDIGNDLKAVKTGNIFNKNDVVNGLAKRSGTSSNFFIEIVENSEYKTDKIKIENVDKISFRAIRVLLFADKDGNQMGEGYGTYSETQTHTVEIPNGTYYIYASAKTGSGVENAHIAIGDALPPYEEFSFDISYQGKWLARDVINFEKLSSFDIKESQERLIYGGIDVNGNLTPYFAKSARIRIPLKKDVKYKITFQSSALILDSIWSENNAGERTEINTDEITGSNSQVAYWIVARKSNNSDISSAELLSSSVKIEYTLKGEKYVEFVNDGISESKTKAEELSTINQYNENLLEKENGLLKYEVEVLNENLTSLVYAKSEGANDSEIIDLKRNDGGKLLLKLHRRENDGFTNYNDAFLPNAKKDFSDVRVFDDKGIALGVKTLYSGNIDVLGDDRLSGESLIHTDSNKFMYAKKGREISRSKDNGYTWEVISIFSDLNNPTPAYVSSIGDVLFVGDSGKLYRSVPPYTSKTMVYDENLYNQGSTILSHSMVQHPDGDLFIGNYQVQREIIISKSTDNGITWFEVYRKPEEYQHIHQLSIDLNQNPVAIYAGLDGGGGILKTTDKGQNWVDLKALNPELPQSSDYGVIYSDESGYRLIGGETHIVGGHSIIKTHDDLNYKAVLDSGRGIYFIKRLGNKLFAGGISSRMWRDPQILMSEDEGETWRTIYMAEPMAGQGVASDGFRFLSKDIYAGATEEQIIARIQSAGTPLRILEGGDNYYALMLVDVPDGCEKITVESGYLIKNEKNILNDYKTGGQSIASIPFNENKNVTKIEDETGTRLEASNFNYKEVGKHLGGIYPFIVSAKNKFTAVRKAPSFYNVEMDLTDGGFNIGFWMWQGEVLDRLYLIKKGNSNLFVDKSSRVYLNSYSYEVGRFPMQVSYTMIRVDINFNSNGTTQMFANGYLCGEKDGYIPLIQGWSGKIDILNMANNDFENSESIIQDFEIRKGNVTQEQARNNYYAKIFDNRTI